MNNQKINIRIAGLLIKDNKILLIRHKKEDKKYWLVPGGNLEYGERIEDCLRREFMEELTMEVQAKDFIFLVESISPNKDRHILNLFYKVEAEKFNIKIGDEDRLDGADFFSSDELDNIIIYPDIKTELKMFLEKGSTGQLSVFKNWI